MSVDTVSQFTASVDAPQSFAPENSFLSTNVFRRQHKLILPDQMHPKFYLKPQINEIKRNKILTNERTSKRVEFLALREAETVVRSVERNIDTMIKAAMHSEGGRVIINTGKDLYE